MSRKSTTCSGRISGNPLTEYDTEELAEAGAEYANGRYGSDMVPYECSNCDKWHLSPRSRQTRAESSVWGCQCTDAQGNPKQAYASRSDAERRAQILNDECGVSLSVYACTASNNDDVFHLTHQSQDRQWSRISGSSEEMGERHILHPYTYYDSDASYGFSNYGYDSDPFEGY